MNAPSHLEVLRLRQHSPQTALPLATAGVERHVWESRFGAMLIEVIDGVAYVNGARVVPAAAPSRADLASPDGDAPYAPSLTSPATPSDTAMPHLRQHYRPARFRLPTWLEKVWSWM